MLLRTVASAGLKYQPPSIFHRSSKTCSKFLMFLTAPQLRVCRNFSVSADVDIFNDVNVQKYLNYVASEAARKSHQSQENSKLLILLDKKKDLENEIKNLEDMTTESDKEFKKLVESEKKHYLESIEQIKSDILYCMLPEYDDNDNRGVELKVIPGIGGEEAKLFSEELYEMYINYAEYKNWECYGDFKDGYVLINGEDVFGHLKQEAGVHRVQRVPVTETSGRTQTSTCSVVVLPQPRSNEMKISEKDVIVEKIKSSGPGGQNVNKRETCVRVKHIPTGVVIENQTSRYQQHNLKEALDRLRGVLFNMEQKKILSERKAMKKEQAGTNDYSDKIRTYNFAQNRVTDHRIHCSIQNLRSFLSGGKELDYTIKEVKRHYSRKELLLNIKNALESVEYKAFEKHQVG